ncbi:alpha-ketoglutarate-dependent dioxygenase alkB homolog 4 isoform 2-T2 [Rhynchonycteris naso]
MAAAVVAAPEVLRECGCKGIRTCLICERQRGGDPPWQHPPQKTHRFIYYTDTGWAVGAEESDFEGWAFPFPGVTLIEDFVTREEETEMVQLMDCEPWKLSQSGRRKQDYGPKVNFRKQKLKTTGFQGLPSFSRDVVRRMDLYPILEDFRPVEQCNLDYCPERGSAIDPHLDDTWLWGERLRSRTAPVEACHPPQTHRGPPCVCHLQGAVCRVPSRWEAARTRAGAPANLSLLSGETYVSCLLGTGTRTGPGQGCQFQR